MKVVDDAIPSQLNKKLGGEYIDAIYQQLYDLKRHCCDTTDLDGRGQTITLQERGRATAQH